MRYADLYEDAKDTLGRCDEATVFRRSTEALRLLANKGLFDPSIATIDIRVISNCVTLPAEVDTVLGVNVGCAPTLIRDRWFQFHLNGPGSREATDCHYTDELGPYCTIRDLCEPVLLVALLEKASDNNKELRVFGWDANGNRIYTANAITGAAEDGFLVPTVFGFPSVATGIPAIAKIDRIQKSVTNGYVQLVSVSPSAPSVQIDLLGNYRPDEQDPLYRRLRIGGRHALRGDEVLPAGHQPITARVIYKKKNPEITSVNDWINLDNREAFLMALKSVKFRASNSFSQAREAEAEAQRLMNEEENSKMPPAALSAPQILNLDTFPCGPDTLIY